MDPAKRGGANKYITKKLRGGGKKNMFFWVNTLDVGDDFSFRFKDN